MARRLATLPRGVDLQASLERFRRHGDDLMDRWDGACFRRPVRLSPTRVAAVWLWPADGAGEQVQFAWAGDLAPAELSPRVAAMILDARPELARLAERDPVIWRLHRLYPGLLPVLHLDPLAALIGFVSAQQVNLAFACSVRREVLLRFGQRLELGEDFVMVPDAERLARAAVDQLAGLRLTRAKARCLVALAQATVLGELEPAVLGELEDAEVERRLTALPGVGPWTARQFLGRVLGRPVLVAGDLGVRRAIRVAYGLAQDPSIAEVEALTAHYGGAALAAQQVLLYHLTQVPAGAGVGSVSSPAWPAPEDPAAPAS